MWSGLKWIKAEGCRRHKQHEVEIKPALFAFLDCNKQEIEVERKMTSALCHCRVVVPIAIFQYDYGISTNHLELIAQV